MYKTINDVRVLYFSQHGDDRGKLVVAECGKEIPFDVQRVFYIYGSDIDVVRGCHANKESEFILVNVAGTSKVKVEDVYGEKKIFDLNQAHMGLYLPTMIWKEMYDFSPDSVLLCMSNQRYNPNEYVRNYDEYKNSGR